MSKLRAVIIATEGITTNLLFEALSSKIDVKKVLIEKPNSKSKILKRRIKSIGYKKVIGQILFLCLALPFLRLTSRRRILDIIKTYGYKNQDIPHHLIFKIKSVNDTNIAKLINSFEPDIIFINGTGILSKKILNTFMVKPTNIHVGITPKYRGIHGGYWALFNNDNDLFGVTLHSVDAGIDTGNIIAQKSIIPNEKDNFCTYPILQYCEGLALAIANIKTLQNTIKVKPLTTESHLFYHPTLIQYLKKYLLHGIK